MANLDKRLRLVQLILYLCLLLALSTYLFEPLARAEAPVAEKSRTRPDPTAGSVDKRVMADTPLDLGAVFLPVAFSGYPDSSYPIIKGALSEDNVTLDSLAAGTVDRWVMDLSTEDVVTLKVAPVSTADIVLSLLDSAGNIVVDQQNNSPAGQVETIADLTVAESGTHSLLIRTEGDIATDYALLLLSGGSYDVDFRGLLSDSDLREDALPADTDHLWFFNGHSGEFVSFTVTPNDDGDTYIEFVDPSGAIINVIDDNLNGEPESVENYPITEDGLYGILIGEFDYNPMSYQIAFLKS